MINESQAQYELSDTRPLPLTTDLKIQVGCFTLDEDPLRGLVWHKIQLAGSALMQNWARSTHSTVECKHSVGIVGEEQDVERVWGWTTG